MRKSVHLVLLASIISILILFRLTGRERWGYILIIIGISVSFLSSIILAIPSTPALKEKSIRSRFIQNLYPAYKSFKDIETVEKGDKGFEEAKYVIEEETGESFPEADELEPIGNKWGLEVEIDEERYDAGSVDMQQYRNRLEHDLEALCHVKGIKMLALGFFIQVLGAIYIAVTV